MSIIKDYAVYFFICFCIGFTLTGLLLMFLPFNYGIVLSSIVTVISAVILTIRGCYEGKNW